MTYKVLVDISKEHNLGNQGPEYEVFAESQEKAIAEIKELFKKARYSAIQIQPPVKPDSVFPAKVVGICLLLGCLMFGVAAVNAHEKVDKSTTEHHKHHHKK